MWSQSLEGVRRGDPGDEPALDGDKTACGAAGCTPVGQQGGLGAGGAGSDRKSGTRDNVSHDEDAVHYVALPRFYRPHVQFLRSPVLEVTRYGSGSTTDDNFFVWDDGPVGNESDANAAMVIYDGASLYNQAPNPIP